MLGAVASKPAKSQNSTGSTAAEKEDDNPLPPELAHLEKALVEKIESEIVHHGQSTTFDEIAGLEFAKKTVNEVFVSAYCCFSLITFSPLSIRKDFHISPLIHPYHAQLICWPMSRPDLFHGLRALPRGLLLVILSYHPFSH